MGAETILSAATAIALFLMCAAFFLTAWRVIKGPTLPDRIVALDMLVAIAIGFIAVIGLNSLLQYLTGAESVRDIPLNGAIEYVDTFMLTMAMTALGTETSIDKFRQAGAKPFVLAGLLYVWLVVGGYFVTKYLVGVL